MVSDIIEHMIGTVAGPQAGGVEDLTARDLLASIKASRELEDAEAARQLVLAARWADLHPPESIHDAAAFTVPGGEHEEPIAGDGAPLVAEFCLAELGAVLGCSTTSAKKLVGHALELRHRLPRLWAQVQAGRVPAWRARSVAEATIHSTPALTVEAAGFVDAQVAAVAGRLGPAQLDRLVAETIKRYDLAVGDPAADPEDGYLHVDPRHVSVDTTEVHFAGTMRMEAELDIADMLDLDRRVAHDAATQAALGSTEPLQRSARESPRQPRPHPDRTRPPRPGRAAPASPKDSDGLPAAREVVLHAHFDATLDDLTTVFGPTGRMEEGQRLVLLDQVKDWCGDSRTKVTIKPVIDLNADLATPAYEVPDRIREQVILRDRDVRVPVVHPPRPTLRRRPRHRVRPPTPRPRADHSPAPPGPPTSPRSAAPTTASRPTPPGATG